jgi:hypothetical protein
MLVVASSLSAQAPAASTAAPVPQWRSFGTKAEGFHALFPSAPEVSKDSVPAGAETFELHSYVAEVGNTALYVGVCDYGAKALGADPQNLLATAKKGVVDHMSARILSEKQITLESSPGIESPGTEFEAESDKLHISSRLYLASGVLYQTMVASPLNEKYADTAKFLDSFQITAEPRAAAPPAAPDWKPYPYPADGFTALFPSSPEAEKQNVATDGGTFEMHTYTAESNSAALIIAVCDYGSTIAGKSPEDILNGAEKGAIQNIKGVPGSNQKIALGSNPGLAFEASNDSAHISARMYLVGNILYQTLVVTPLKTNFPDTAKFFDSFKLIDRAAK